MDHSATILLIGADSEFARRFDDVVSDSYHVRAVGGPASAADAADAALVAIDGRPDGRAVGHLLGTVRERGYDGPVVAVVDDPDDPPEVVDEALGGAVDPTDLRATVESLAPVGHAPGGATVFDALGDPKGRRCCRALLEEPRSAQELADATGYSLPTVYRRLDALTAAGLVVARTRIRAGGSNHEVYRTVTTGLHVDLADGFRVDLERPVDEPEA